jgi:hypothetical protein
VISSHSTDVRRGVPYRGEHCQTAERTAADIEGQSAAGKFGQPRRLSAMSIIACGGLFGEAN